MHLSAEQCTCLQKRCHDVENLNYSSNCSNNQLYWPNLAPSDFHLLPHLKIFLRVKRFSTNKEVIAAVERYFEHMEKYFRHGISKLENRWKKWTLGRLYWRINGFQGIVPHESGYFCLSVIMYYQNLRGFVKLNQQVVNMNIFWLEGKIVKGIQILFFQFFECQK